MTLTLSDIDRWDPGAVRDVFLAAQSRGQASIAAAKDLSTLSVFDSWGGDAAVAAKDSIAQTRQDLDDHGKSAFAVAHAASKAATGIDRVKADLKALRDKAASLGLVVDAATGRVKLDPASDKDPIVRLGDALELQKQLDAILADARAVDDTLADAIDMADGDNAIPVIRGPEQDAPTRLQNQIDAFKQVFGVEPISAADWQTAEMLDPHSYDAKNHGVPANIVVGRINKVPGQGQVRGGFFIPSEYVNCPNLRSPWELDKNLGDHRGFNPTAGPESSRVAFMVDYENGIVIVRQNPSVNATQRQIAVGTPDVNVLQHSDGSVLMTYNTADPFSPGGEWIAKNSVGVDGTLVITPDDSRPGVAGTISSFPAVEIYHDRPPVGGPPNVLSTTELVTHWPERVDQWGPMAGLWTDATIGDPSLADRFMPNTLPPILLPRTKLGDAAAPPTVVTFP